MEERVYESLVDMFASDGWKHFIEDAAELESVLTHGAVDAADSNEKWQHARGQIHQLRAILGYEDFITHSYTEQQKDKLADMVGNDPDVNSI